MKKMGHHDATDAPYSFCVPIVFQYMSGQLLVKDERWFEFSRPDQEPMTESIIFSDHSILLFQMLLDVAHL